MPVRKKGNCYQYGNQKKYCGAGARRKAAKQGAAIRAAQARRKKK